MPSWRKQQLAGREMDDRFAYAETLGNIMGLDDDTTTVPAAAGDDDTDAPLGNVARHRIGRDFILAGRAVFTVSGAHSRFTFRITRKESDNPRYPDPTFFVSVLTGGNNETAYTYMAILDPRTGGLTFTKGSKIGKDAPAAVALAWTLARVWAGRPLPEPAAIYAEGRCGRCGRPLTDPESILKSFGPECREIMGIE